MENEYHFKAFVYNYHIQAVLVAILMLFIIVLLPAYVIFNYIWIDWKGYNFSLVDRLWRFTIVGGPLAYAYGRLMVVLFRKEIDVRFDRQNMSIIFLNSKTGKNYIEGDLISFEKISITERQNKNAINKTLQIHLQNDMVESIYIVSPEKINNDFVKFRDFCNDLNTIANSTDKKNI